MNKRCLLLAICAFATIIVCAAPRYWVGPFNGNWNNSDNWSVTSGGPGGAGVPGDQDSVIINKNALINVDVSPVIASLRITFQSKVTIYTAVPTTFTINNFLDIERYESSTITTLKDSTSADVPFNFIFNAATRAKGRLLGHWVFEGGVPVSPGNGPTFTAAPGTLVSLYGPFPNTAVTGSIILKKHSADITSDPSTLSFSHYASFVLDNPVGAIPNAFWEGARVIPRVINYLPSIILITGNLTGELRHLSGKPEYGTLNVELTGLTADASLALPHGTLVKDAINIRHTNYHTLTLLAATSPSDSVAATIGVIGMEVPTGGTFSMSASSGNSTRVAMARATSASPATTYRLQLYQDFNQEGGNFSLQDYDGATGSSTLSTKGNVRQTSGTFITNSTATGGGAKFVLEMDAPLRISDQFGVINTYKGILMSSETIDNGRKMVTLRINHPSVFQPTGAPVAYGVGLSGHLTVGRLDLERGPLSTSNNSIITISDPDVTTGLKSNGGYVSGPVRRWTNSTSAYFFPTGKGISPPAPNANEPCEVIPSSDEPSLYQAEYFLTRYVDTQNVKPPLTGVSIARYWDISRISGADASVRLRVRNRVPRATKGDALVVARYVDGQWVSEEGTRLSPGDTTGGSVVSRPLSAFSPFTFGYYPAVNTPPVFVNCPAAIVVNTEPNSCNALVSFQAESGEHSTLTYKIGSTEITSPYSFQRGSTVVDVTASDGSGSATCSFTVTVNDQLPPVITAVSANPATLSPANDELKHVYIGYSATDNCGPVTTTLSVSSNGEPDGNWEIVDEHNLKLRAESSDEGRIYTITITSTDASGNQSMNTVTVTVPKDKEKKKLKVKIAPNPARTYFTLNVTGNSSKPVTMRVFDHFGRIKEVRQFYPDATIRLGNDYRPGIYFVIFKQGNTEMIATLIKLP